MPTKRAQVSTKVTNLVKGREGREGREGRGGEGREGEGREREGRGGEGKGGQSNQGCRWCVEGPSPQRKEYYTLCSKSHPSNEVFACPKHPVSLPQASQVRSRWLGSCDYREEIPTN